MIEVEKKFILAESDVEKLKSGAEFIGEKVFTDVYYDQSNYALTGKDIWLRERSGRFELKIPMSEVLTREAEQYEEVEEEKEIIKKLGLPSGKTMHEILEKAGFEIFCVCTTRRQKYRHGDFIIDLDEVTYPEFVYQIGEIELMVEDKSEMAEATKKIMDFAAVNGVKFAPVRGKVIEYLKRIRPSHYRAMVEAKVIIDY